MEHGPRQERLHHLLLKRADADDVAAERAQAAGVIDDELARDTERLVRVAAGIAVVDEAAGRQGRAGADRVAGKIEEAAIGTGQRIFVQRGDSRHPTSGDSGTDGGRERLGPCVDVDNRLVGVAGGQQPGERSRRCAVPERLRHVAQRGARRVRVALPEADHLHPVFGERGIDRSDRGEDRDAVPRLAAARTHCRRRLATGRR